MRYIVYALIGDDDEVYGDHIIKDFQDTYEFRHYIELNQYASNIAVNDLILGDSYFFANINHGLTGMQPLMEFANA